MHFKNASGCQPYNVYRMPSISHVFEAAVSKFSMLAINSRLEVLVDERRCTRMVRSLEKRKKRFSSLETIAEVFKDGEKGRCNKSSGMGNHHSADWKDSSGESPASIVGACIKSNVGLL